MTFSTDRDLLAIEPHVFRDVPLLGQQRIKVNDGAISGTTLTSVTADFEAAQVTAGAVVLVAGLPMEVLSRTDANTLEVSMLRFDSQGAAIPSSDGSGLEVVVRTFSPQAALMRDALLRLLDMDEDDPGHGLSAASILSASLMQQLEALGTLERIYSAAFALAGDNAALHDKARLYRGRFRTACLSATVLIDTDGDGLPDIWRPLGVVKWQRV